MSRIQEILKKAEREGGVHRTRSFVAEGPAIDPGPDNRPPGPPDPPRREHPEPMG